ncbi:MAG TPA: NAD-dependent epimerase/dehydratase family protein [Actinomycetota bacterium]|nr:NAD-dependent epimerase/dehydratase family protein [Actinomycetota bacterium]
MKAVVTGGAGFIGCHLAERLVAEGREVLAIDDLSSGKDRVGVLEAAGARLEVADIREPGTAEIVRSYEPNEVFHLAAQKDVRHSVADPAFDAEVNVVGTIRLLEAARSVGANVVTTSSGGCIYGDPDESLLPISEGTVGRPTSPYGISKKVMEDYLHFYRSSYGMQFVNLALANVYGPRQDPNGEAGVVAIFAQRLLRGQECTIYGDGGQTRDFVYVADVVDAYLRAASGKAWGETFNIGTGRETSVVELYSEIARICGVDLAPNFAPERLGELRRSALDYGKAEKLLGWRPVTSLEEGLERTVDSMKAAVLA